jgi:hypothetical protein
MLPKRLSNRSLSEQQATYDVPARWKVDTAPQPLQVLRVDSPAVVQPDVAMSVRFDHGNGDYTIVLGSIIPGPAQDPVEVDYSFVDDE